MIDKLFVYGFEYLNTVKVKIDDHKENAKIRTRTQTKLKFGYKGFRPTEQESLEYLESLFNSNNHSNIEFIYDDYYNNDFDEVITTRIIVDDDFIFKNILPYKNLDEDDPKFIGDDEQYSINYLTKLLFRRNDGIKVKLF